LAHILLQMLESGLKGLYHVVSSECASKYDFGVALAERFGFDPGLISPTSVEQSNLKATRSPNLTLKADKLIRDLGEVPPRISTSLEAFYRLYQQGYPQALWKMRGE
jgi:dTDP-4-dehydrorhamnose reductase